jgi:hypothetical protein
MKTYQVQTWNPDGSLKDHYRVDVESDSALRQLRSFLKTHSAHVMLTPLPKKVAVKAKRK